MNNRIFLGGFAALAGAILIVGLSSAQMNPATGNNPAPQSTTPKVVVVNIAKVMREFKAANDAGKVIQERRVGHTKEMEAVAKTINDYKTKIATPATQQAEKDRLTAEITRLTREAEDKTRNLEKQLSEVANKTIVEVYSDVKAAIDALARARNYELVLCYPDGSTAEELQSPQLAQLKLQSPAAMPFYVAQGLDQSDTVIQMLNENFKQLKSISMLPNPSSVIPVKGP